MLRAIYIKDSYSHHTNNDQRPKSHEMLKSCPIVKVKVIKENKLKGNSTWAQTFLPGIRQ